jgi:hypothetical protein
MHPRDKVPWSGHSEVEYQNKHMIAMKATTVATRSWFAMGLERKEFGREPVQLIVIGSRHS